MFSKKRLEIPSDLNQLSHDFLPYHLEKIIESSTERLALKAIFEEQPEAVADFLRHENQFKTDQQAVIAACYCLTEATDNKKMAVNALKRLAANANKIPFQNVLFHSMILHCYTRQYCSHVTIENMLSKNTRFPVYIWPVDLARTDLNVVSLSICYLMPVHYELPAIRINVVETSNDIQTLLRHTNQFPRYMKDELLSVTKKKILAFAEENKCPSETHVGCRRILMINKDTPSWIIGRTTDSLIKFDALFPPEADDSIKLN